MLRIRDLTLHYGQSQILHGIDLDAAPGEITCVMGTNGVGKTSLLKAIAGTHPRSGGTVALDNETLDRATAFEMARRGVGYVPQGRDIFPLLTVRENLETGYACLPRGERNVANEIYDLFPVLKKMAGRRGGDLSGGQQQQLAIARALVIRPRVLLLDEPTEGIQPNIIQQIGRVISHLKDEGLAIVLVEQYFDFAFDLADRIVVMDRGHVVHSAPKSEADRQRITDLMSV
ncbi:urea ABC transporter ATP-binding subunit UrtE [Palleronia sp. LCG004]|uniref:urea ABC transporter ATP-binding subunit UrtE n=1 Tax=Palleronia sp. LCG004 TaxID=3079304 RepID=UPI0029436A49|nr:urea ABC transporter ATP-binding subunit UrtE [Palleronia sp. LCG004]WOI57456.1 urea ABC transporter ATP-binding subunit UrtE [Palleronia sp. LCG004]